MVERKSGFGRNQNESYYYDCEEVISLHEKEVRTTINIENFVLSLSLHLTKMQTNGSTIWGNDK